MMNFGYNNENWDLWAGLINLSPGKVRPLAEKLGPGEAKALRTKDENHLVVVTCDSFFWGYGKAGKGGESEVYFARQYSLNGGDALDKVVKLSRNSFGGQARSLKGLSPNSKQSPFIDLIEGRFRMGNMRMMVVQKMDRDLAHVNWKQYRKPGSQLVTWLEDCLRGLASLHRKDLVHRDIKGANFLVKDNGGAKITDFGLAGKLLSKEHGTSITPGFGAPFIWKSLDTQLKRRGLQDKEADIWSVGRMIQDVVKSVLKQYGLGTKVLNSRVLKFPLNNEKALREIRKFHKQYGGRAATTPIKDCYLTVIHPDRDGVLGTSVTAINLLQDIDLSEKKMLRGLASLARDLLAPTRQELCEVLGVDPSKGSQRDLLVQKVLGRLDRIRPEQMVNFPLQENRSPNPKRTGQVVRKRDFEDEDEIETYLPTVLVPETQGAKKKLKF